MVSVSISSKNREGVGTKQAKADRNNGFIPAVIYGGSDAPQHILVNLQEVKKVVYTPSFKIAEIDVDGKVQRCIVKSTQYHPVTDALTHIDFLRIVEGNKIKLDVPVVFVGTSPGVKNGGKLIQQVRKVTVKTLPSTIIDSVSVDISSMELGGVVRVKNINIPEGVEIMANGSIPIANIEIPRALKSAAAEEKKAEGKKK